MKKLEPTHRYDDIIRLPHHVSPQRRRMTMVERGAQFSPFAALTGYDEAVKETARLTSTRVELTEGRKTEIDRQIRALSEQPRPRVQITWFCPDSKKEGGSYEHTRGILLKADSIEKVLLLEDGTRIPFDSITSIEAPEIPDVEYSWPQETDCGENP